FRGFAKGLEGADVADGKKLADAFCQASDTAYKAVMKPREGTILTVAREMGEQAIESAESCFEAEALLREVIARGKDVLEMTPLMLAELRAAGVVDAGGKGLLVFLEGAASVINSGAEADVSITVETASVAGREAAQAPVSAAASSAAEIHFAYCTEFFIDLSDTRPGAERQSAEKAEAGLREFLAGLGDSIVAVADGDIVKIHVHTNHPGNVLERALNYGSLSSIKIENMRQQHTSLINFTARKPEPVKKHKPVGIVAVASGAGFKDLFVNLGADEIVEGGQTMNPSAEDILKAVEGVSADAVIILPNNGNIVLAAQQAAALCQGKKASVVPSRTIPQGLAAMVSFLPTASGDENISEMTASIGAVRTGQVTQAVRDAILNGKEIREGDHICVMDGEIVAVNAERRQAVMELLDIMLSAGGDVVSVYYGEGVRDAEADEMAEYVRENYQEFEVEMYAGGQPVYSFIVSVE
ncbi:MAG: DAK2 domain-containing protein, partial [Defluviitaleaceae bacterium]|nr:DAK2 domain-containing protein [Defluviitaleaceae bacterium]